MIFLFHILTKNAFQDRNPELNSTQLKNIFEWKIFASGTNKLKNTPNVTHSEHQLCLLVHYGQTRSQIIPDTHFLQTVLQRNSD